MIFSKITLSVLSKLLQKKLFNEVAESLLKKVVKCKQKDNVISLFERVIVHAVTIDYSIMIICSKWSKLEKKNALLATLFNLKLKTTREY